MQQLIIHIKDKDKTEILLNFLRSLNYITVEQVEDDAELTGDQKYMLDERRAENEEFITWNEAKQQLYTKK